MRRLFIMTVGGNIASRRRTAVSWPEPTMISRHDGLSRKIILLYDVRRRNAVLLYPGDDTAARLNISSCEIL